MIPFNFYFHLFRNLEGDTQASLFSSETVTWLETQTKCLRPSFIHEEAKVTILEEYQEWALLS
jgi:hypothetical protein